MSSIQEALRAARRQRLPGNGEYLRKQDGLICCRACDTPVEEDIPLRDGGTLRVPILCRCAKEREAAEAAKREERRHKEAVERLKTMGFPDKALIQSTFANDKGYNPEIAHARRYVERFEELSARGMGLLLWGDVGTGKTYIATCVANALMDREIPVFMTNFSRVMNAMLGMGGLERNAFLDGLRRYRLLIIDDLGMERNSSYALEQVYNVIDSRSQSGKPMLITTNLTVAEMKAESDLAHARIYDRVLAGCYPVMISSIRIRQRAAVQNGEEEEKLFKAP